MKLQRNVWMDLGVLTCALLVGGVAHAKDLVITEDSSTSLTATWDGLPVSVLNTGPDTWILDQPAGIHGIAAWAEPDNSGAVNIITGEGNLVSIKSDSFEFPADHANGETDTARFFKGDTPVNVTFIDHGDVRSSVPESGRTFLLLGLSLAACGVFGKRQSNHLIDQIAERQE